MAAELDSLDGRKDPQRCTLLVSQFRSCQVSAPGPTGPVAGGPRLCHQLTCSEHTWGWCQATLGPATPKLCGEPGDERSWHRAPRRQILGMQDEREPAGSRPGCCLHRTGLGCGGPM